MAMVGLVGAWMEVVDGLHAGEVQEDSVCCWEIHFPTCDNALAFPECEVNH